MAFCRIAIASLVLTGLWLFIGCGGDSQGRYAISGSVNVDGAPLQKGNISFQAMEEQRTSSGAVVSGGNFSIPRASGLVVGKYRVVINAPVPGAAGKVTPPDAQPGDPPPPPKELIPPDWNVSSEHTIEVKREGPFVFSFEIATKGK